MRVGLSLGLLGALELTIDGARQPLGGARQRAVLAALALHANRFVSVDSLITDLWDDDERLRQPRNNVQVYVSNLRRIVRDHDDSLAIVGEPGGYRLVVAPGVLDHAAFLSGVDAGRDHLRRGRAASAVAALESALALWRGPFLADLAVTFDVFSDAAREMDEERLHAVELKIDAELQRGDGGHLVPELEQLVTRHPERERFWVQLMTVQYRVGRQADALRTSQRARSYLADELGLDPGHELRQFELDVATGAAPLRPAVAGVHIVYVDPGGRDVRVPLVPGSAYTIGRHPDADLCIDGDVLASRTHARIADAGGRWTIEDCGSTNGTSLNGRPVATAEPLVPGDVFVVGSTSFAVADPSRRPALDVSPSHATMLAPAADER